MKKENLITYFFILFCAVILALTLRGLSGNPILENLASPFWEKSGPFESSGERARFALMYSFIENKSLQLSIPLARFSTPDLAINKDNQYVSLFAPGVSFLIIPGYIFGKYFGVSQLGAYAVVAVFAFLNILLVRKIAVKLGANPLAANFGAFIFAFATPAFSYAVTLSQHHISTFLILFGIYLLIGKKKWFSLPLFWFLFSLSVAIDNPNFFMMLPLAFYAAAKSVSTKKELGRVVFSVHFFSILAIAAAVIPLTFFLWFNQASQGDPFKLSGALERVLTIKENGLPEKSVQNASPGSEVSKNSILGFFNTRNLSNGFYIHFASPDRGMINYTPIALLGALGLIYLFFRNALFGNIVIAIIGFNILLYSMWGDPYGGWSFGSRYLIPSYALMSIGLSFIISEWKKSAAALFIVFVLFAYSSWVNVLGAITTNVIPPRIEAEAMEKVSGQVQKYTYERNKDYLVENGSKSFIYQVFLKNKLPARKYFEIITIIVWSGGLILLAGAGFLEYFAKHKN